jgi:hypothetical protein
LTPGEYFVKPTAPKDYVVKSYSSGEIPATVVYNVATDVPIELEAVPTTGSIQGTVLVKICTDSSQNGGCDKSNAVPLNDIVVNIIPEGSATPFASVPTGSDGTANFTVPSGNYYAQVPGDNLPAGVTFSGPDGGSTPIIMVGDKLEFASLSIPVVVLGKITGSVWVDFDKDGIRGDSKSGLLDCIVDVKSVDGTITSAKTDSSGFYSISVSIGTYTVTFTNPNVKVFFFSGVIKQDNQCNDIGVAADVLVAPEKPTPVSAGLLVDYGSKCAPTSSNDIVGNGNSGSFSVTGC